MVISNELYILVVAGTLMLGLFVYTKVRVDLLVDQTREALFMLRDDFFIQAMDNELSFESRAYVLVRQYLNAKIRYAHRISYLNVLCMLVSIKIYGKDIGPVSIIDEVKIACREVTDKNSELILSVIKKSQIETIRLIMARSPITTLLIGLSLLLINGLKAVTTILAVNRPEPHTFTKIFQARNLAAFASALLIVISINPRLKSNAIIVDTFISKEQAAMIS